MDYSKLVADELERSGLASVFGLRVKSHDGERVTLTASPGGEWTVSAPALMAMWRGRSRDWGYRAGWSLILSDLDAAWREE